MQLHKAMLGAGLLLLSGCGKFFPPLTPSGGGSGSGVGDYLYVGNSGNTNGSIAEFAVSTTGALTAVSGSPFKAGFAPTALAISPNNQFMYAGGSSGVYLLNIGTGGALSLGNASKAAASSVNPSSMQVDPTGKFLLVAGVAIATTTPAVGIYSIAGDGTLAEMTGSPVSIPVTVDVNNPLTLFPVQLTITPSDAVVYVSLRQNGVAVFSFNSSGSLAFTNQLLKPGTSTGAGGSVTNSDLALATDANSRLLYVSETNAGLRAFTIGTNGALTEISGSPYKTTVAPVALTLDGTGDYIYAATPAAGNATTAGTITGFSIAASGSLTALTSQGSPFAAGISPASLTVDQSKKFLAVVNTGGTPDLQIYSSDATTAGKLVTGATSATDTAPAQANIVVSTH